MAYTPHTEEMSLVYICQNDKPMTSFALSTAHQAYTNLCQPSSLKGCHIFIIDLSKTCHPQFLFFAIVGSHCQYNIKFQNILGKQALFLSSWKYYQTKLVQNIYISSVLKVRSQFAVRFVEFHEKTRIALHKTHFSSEQTMRTIYEPLQLNSKSSLLL